MAYNPDDLTESRRTELEAFMLRLGVGVKRLDIINQALTHRSYSFEHPPVEDNERLEFLGDSVLGFVISDYFFQRYPEASEGDLSKKKARVVSRALLGRVAKSLDLGDLIRLGHGEERTGGRRRASLLGSALEALIGAVYLSEGFEVAARFVREQLIVRLADMMTQDEEWDYKSRLQELAQKRFQTTPRYEVVSTSGPDHDKTFSVRVLLMGQTYPAQSAPRKKSAENQAARVALEVLESEASSKAPAAPPDDGPAGCATGETTRGAAQSATTGAEPRPSVDAPAG